MASTPRFKWFEIIVYYDDFWRFEVFDYLRNHNTCAYIKHEPEEEGKKKHIHCLIHFDRAMTESGFQSSPGKYPYAQINDKCIPIKHDEVSYYENLGYEVEKRYPFFIGEGGCMGVHSPESRIQYFMHKDIQSVIMGNKRQYDASDIVLCGDTDMLKKLFVAPYVDKKEILQNLYSISQGCRTPGELLDQLFKADMFNEIEYVRSNPYFVREFMVGRG